MRTYIYLSTIKIVKTNENTLVGTDKRGVWLPRRRHFLLKVCRCCFSYLFKQGFNLGCNYLRTVYMVNEQLYYYKVMFGGTVNNGICIVHKRPTDPLRISELTREGRGRQTTSTRSPETTRIDPRGYRPYETVEQILEATFWTC